jgi:F-type H+-transporting ATPase subunit b
MRLFTDGFIDPQSITDKLIPNGIWPFIIQLLSTLVMFFIVKKFLYVPVKSILDKRAQFVQTTIDEAVLREKQAQELKAALEAESKKVQQSLIALRQEAQEEMALVKNQMLSEAQAQALRLKRKAEEEILQAKALAIQSMEQEMISIALDASRQVLKRELTEKDNAKVVEDFIKGLRN